MTFSYSKTLERQEKNQIASCWDNTASQSTSCLVTKQGFPYCMSQTYPKKEEVKLLTKHLQITFKSFSTVDSTQLVSDQVKNRAYRSDTKCRLVSLLHRSRAAVQFKGTCLRGCWPTFPLLPRVIPAELALLGVIFHYSSSCRSICLGSHLVCTGRKKYQMLQEGWFRENVKEE